MRGAQSFHIEGFKGYSRDTSPIPRARKPGTAYTAENCRFFTTGVMEKLGGRTKLASNLFTGVDTSELFTGAGLDDLTPGGTFTGTAITNYRVKIDLAAGTDTFTWSDDGGSTWDDTGVAITGSAQTLNNGVTITFAATTGHTLGDIWDFNAGPLDILGLAEARVGGLNILVGATSVEIKKMEYAGGAWTSTDISGDWSPACTPDRRYSFATLNDLLIISDFAVSKLYKWSGTGDVAAMGVTGSGITTLKARYLATIGDFLFLGYTDEDGTVYKSRVRWSHAGTPETWTATQYQDLGTDDGDEITGIVSLQSIAIVFKRESIWAGYYDSNLQTYVFQKIVPNKGNIAPFALWSKDNRIFFVSYDGIYIYEGTPTPRKISDPEVSDYITETITEDDAEQIWVAENPDYPELWFCSQNLPSSSFPTWIYNFKTDDWTLSGFKHGAIVKVRRTARETWDSIPASAYTWNSVHKSFDTAFNVTQGIIFVGGDENGDVHQLDIGAYSDNGAAITTTFRTNPIDCELPDKWKRFVGITFKLRPTAATLTIRIYIDGTQIGGDLSTTVSADAPEYAEQTVYIDAVGKKIEVEIENATIVESMRLMGMTLHYIPREDIR